MAAIRRVAFVIDSVMIATASIRNELKPAGIIWRSAVKAADLRKLAGSAAPSIRAFDQSGSPIRPPRA